MLLIATTLCLAPATQALTCWGAAPNWRITLGTLGDNTATFQLRDKTGTFTLPHTATALNDPDTTAYTLIGSSDTAILLVHPGRCNSQNLTAHVMTQDHGTAILLSGCCQKAPQ